ncbi:MAG TPA: acylneuraminate cytidylyltransferase family protein [Acidobacteriota bacterium]|nr:acylneuraminate cytidylyltransferase family protein [Acidobacteriota bacterium]
MFAYVPARGGSKRLPRKNIRPLAGRPLLLRVLDALAQVEGLSGIGVSSEDPEILHLAGSHPDAVTLQPRRAELADDLTPFVELARRDVPRFARCFNDSSVLFVLATAALVPPEFYREALIAHEKNPGGLIISVTSMQASPFRALVGDPQEELRPLFPERFPQPTWQMPPAYQDAGCFYAFRMDGLQGKEKFLDLKPVQAVVLPPEVGIDVDTPDDWQRLEKAFEDR